MTGGHLKQGNFSIWSHRYVAKQRGRRENKMLASWEVVDLLLLALKQRDSSQRLWMTSGSWKWPPAKGRQGYEDHMYMFYKYNELNSANLNDPGSQFLEPPNIRPHLAKTLFLFCETRNRETSLVWLLIFRTVS